MRFRRRLLLTFSLFLLMLMMPVAFGDGEAVEHIGVQLPENIISGLPVVNQSVSMDQAVQLGLENNLGVQANQSETAIRQAVLKDSQGMRWPVVSLGALTFLRAGDSQIFQIPEMNMNTVDTVLFEDLSATTRLPLFTGGKLKGGVQASRFALEGSQADLQQTMVDTAYQIKAAYLKALFAESEHVVHQHHIEVQAFLLKNAQVRYRLGKGLKADVLRIQTELADAQKMLNNEHTQLNDALLDLKAAMGVDLASDIQLADTLSYTPWEGSQVKELIQELLTHHPKIQVAKSRVAEAEAQVRIAKSEYLPQVYGQVTGNLRFPDRPPMLGNGVIGMMSATLPVFDRSRSAKLEQAEATLRKAQQEYKAVQLEVAKAVAKVWSELQFAQENIRLSNPAVEQAQEDLRLIQKRFEAGRAISVEVQDTALALRQAELNKNQAVYSQASAKARLVQALGKIDTGANNKK